MSPDQELVAYLPERLHGYGLASVVGSLPGFTLTEEGGREALQPPYEYLPELDALEVNPLSFFSGKERATRNDERDSSRTYGTVEMSAA